MDGIPAELYKAAGPVTLSAFHDTLISLWEEEAIPHDFRDATVVPLFKNKGAVEQIVAITEESLFCPSPARFSHVLSLTG